MYGPQLLSEYDRVNKEKDDLLTRMIKQMRARSASRRDENDKPIHPKYSLLKLDLSPENVPKAEKRPARKEQSQKGGVRESNEPKALRKEQKR